MTSHCQKITTEMENVTLRKPRRSSSLQNLSNSSSLLFDNTIASLPNTSIDENMFTRELHEKIFKLSEGLNIANLEVENLNYENTKLKKELERCNKIIEMYKTIGTQDGKTHTPSSRRRGNKNKIQRNSTTNTPEKSSINQTQPKTTEPTAVSSENISPNYFDNNHSTTLEQLQSDIISELHYSSPKSEQNAIINHEHKCTPPSNIKNNQEKENKKKVIILADQQGRGVQRNLEKLLGDDANLVMCLWKPGATLSDILSAPNEDLSNLGKQDHIVIIGGTNDRNPFTFQLSVNNWLHSLTNTNVTICEIPYNASLNVQKLNYELKFACSRYNNAYFLDLEYEQNIPKGSYFTRSLCTFLLRNLLHINYKLNYLTFKEKNHVIKKFFPKIHKFIQTDLTLPNPTNKIDVSTQTTKLDLCSMQITDKHDVNKEKNFFRV